MTDRQPGRLGGTPEHPARFFADAAQFRAWLELNDESADELWMAKARLLLDNP